MTEHDFAPKAEQNENSSKDKGSKVFPVLLKIVAALSIFGAFIGATNFSGHDGGVALLWVAAGLVTSFSWWSLSYIVAAALKYLDKKD